MKYSPRDSKSDIGTSEQDASEKGIRRLELVGAER